ncbi:MAG: IS4 family transposase [Acidobacteria bacterium]|nr:IS4 family transposase [Acidobacteriota bacterium]
MNRNVITVKRAGRLIDWVAGESLHAKRVQSVTNAVVGVVNAFSLSIHAIGAGLAQTSGLHTKHAIKQVDRLLSHPAFNVWELFAHWVPYVLAATQEIVVALDWTDFDADGHSTIALYLVTAHGRATPLVWMSVKKAQLKGQRNLYEDTVLLRLHEVLPPGVKVTILADRGFGDQHLYAHLTDLGFDFIIRFRGDVMVQSRDGEVRLAHAWVPPNGKTRQLKDARVTADRYSVDSVVCVKAHGMKDAWCLAVGGGTRTGATAVKLYARRFTIEETFRDTKDPRYGLGLSATHVHDVRRRDRLLLICAMAMTLLTLLGAAGESLGMDRMLKANTVKTRTHSLFRQGFHYYAAIPAMKQELLEPLVQRFGEYVLGQAVYVHAFGLK